MRERKHGVCGAAGEQRAGALVAEVQLGERGGGHAAPLSAEAGEAERVARECDQRTAGAGVDEGVPVGDERAEEFLPWRPSLKSVGELNCAAVSARSCSSVRAVPSSSG